MNPHLNMFKYFNESDEVEFIENNLSRAFAICLKQDSLFFSQYLKSIMTEEDYEYLFTYSIDKISFEIDLQVNTNNLEIPYIRSVYAVAMTANNGIDMDDFLQLNCTDGRNINLTDIFILIKDIAIVIEVKRDNIDCKQQLFDQIHPIVNNGQNIKTTAKDFPWQKVVLLMEQVVNIKNMNGEGAGIIKDFLDFSEMKYPHWFSSKPLFSLPDFSQQTNKFHYARVMRLKQIIDRSSQKLLNYQDRMAIGVDFGWASEVIPYFKSIDGIDYIIFTIWPGNTKKQGYSVYSKSLDWVNNNSMDIFNKTYLLKTNCHMKFSHFNKFITALDFGSEVLAKPINTLDNFKNNSGYWDIGKWPDFMKLLDEHFLPSYDWRSNCDFYNHFESSERSYFTVSFGFKTDLFIPFDTFREIDKKIDEFDKASSFIDSIIENFRLLIG